MHLHENRITYPEIKQWVLEAYFDFCRDRGVSLGRPHEEVLGGITLEHEECFDRPIEQLMLEVVNLVLNGGWYLHPMQHHREKIRQLIIEYGIDNLLADIPDEEARQFRHDLRILKLI